MATLTLTRMSEGGLYDQLGGGFCRYSVDPYWMIPHFEKMLYDNGQLLAVCAQAAVATGEPLFGRVTAETAAWMRRDMEHAEGGFYATLDADSEGHEGKFYVWTPDEVRGLLDEREYAVFSRRFGLDREANFEGRWHLHAFEPLAGIAAQAGLGEAEADAVLDSARGKLLAVRDRRIRPGRDEKILTGWNGLAIAGLASAARALDSDDLVDAAARAVAFLRDRCWSTAGCSPCTRTDSRGFRLPRRLRLPHLGAARAAAGALGRSVARVGGRARRKHARALRGPRGRRLLVHADDHESLILRPKTFGDDATPAGNGVAARALLRLGGLLAEPRYLDAAERTLRAAWPLIERYPHAHTSLLMALDEYTEPPTVVVLRGAATDVAVWRAELDRLYDPRRVVFAIPDDAAGLPPALADKRPGPGTLAYLCRGTSCSAPVTTLGELRRALESVPG